MYQDQTGLIQLGERVPKYFRRKGDGYIEVKFMNGFDSRGQSSLIEIQVGFTPIPEDEFFRIAMLREPQHIEPAIKSGRLVRK